MNWKREVVEKLQQYAVLQHAVRNIPDEIIRLENHSRGLRSLTACTIPGKGGENRYEQMLINDLVQKQEMKWTLAQTQRWLQSVDRGLKALNPVQKKILEKMYIYPEEGAPQLLCRELGIELSSLYRRREEALKQLTLAMYGALES